MCFFCAFDGIVLLLCLKFLLENVTTNQHCCIKSLLRDTIPLFSLVNTCFSFQSEMKKKMQLITLSLKVSVIFTLCETEEGRGHR